MLPLCVLFALSFIQQPPGIPNLYHMKLSSIIHHLFRRRKTSSVDTTPQKNIQLHRYMGRWYEQARFENWFETGLEHVYTDYSLSPEGHLNIINAGIKMSGAISSTRGRGIPGGDGRFRVSFVPPYHWFQAPYHILYTDPDYNSALVSGAGDAYLWLLTRQARADNAQIATLLTEAQQRGFDTSQLHYTIQEG